jgi:hypothetical protein
LTNEGVAPVHFELAAVQPSEQFSFAPATGVIPAGAAFVVAARFCATSASACSGTASLVLNHNTSAAQQLALFGAGYTAAVALDVGSELICPPTCAGATSRRTLRMHNNSRLAVACHWVCGADDDDVLSMEPSSVLLRGETGAQVTCVFKPRRTGVFQSMATCRVAAADGAGARGGNHLGTNAEVSDTHGDLKLVLSGESTGAALSMEPASVQLGPLQVGSISTVELTIFNHSPGALQYVLERRDADGQAHCLSSSASASTSASARRDPCEGEGQVLSVSKAQGVIAPRSFIVAMVFVRPAVRGRVQESIVCRTTQPGQGADSASITAVMVRTTQHVCLSLF